MEYIEIKQLLEEKGQIQLLRFYDKLDDKEKSVLLNQIENIDWNSISPEEADEEGEIEPIEGVSCQEIRKNSEMFFKIGSEQVKSGKVAAVLLAGGQGTRLGSSLPKGMFDIGINATKYIFEFHIENLKKVCKDTNGKVPLLIMTSEKNDSVTREFFARHNYFGYPKEDIYFYVQDMAPATDFEGRVLLEEKGKIALSPNGNGGWFSSLVRAGLLDKMEERKVEWFNVFSVDNVLQHIADPLFVGATIANNCQCGSKVVKKTCPEEKVGVLCLKGGRPHVVEYYELSSEMANEKIDGELVYKYGVILNYLFNVNRLKEIASKNIPLHIVKKKVEYIDENGEKVIPERENAYKYETLILDLVRLMGQCLPYEVEREKEFAPVKNRTGVDSVDSARELLQKNGFSI